MGLKGRSARGVVGADGASFLGLPARSSHRFSGQPPPPPPQQQVAGKCLSRSDDPQDEGERCLHGAPIADWASQEAHLRRPKSDGWWVILGGLGNSLAALAL